MKKNCECNPRLGKVGGQAVLNGVMMKHEGNVAVSVRKSDGTIASDGSECVGARKKHKALNIPIVRGVVNFIEMLKLSMGTLSKSADLSGAMDAEPETKFEKWLDKKFGKKVGDFIVGIGMFFGILLAVALFFLLPNFLATQLNKLIKVPEVWEAVFAGAIKIIIFILYLWLVSLMKEIRVTFEYHGAEHKSIFCYESGEELTVENVKRHRRFHPRCGTSFMFVMMIIGIILALAARLVITYAIGFKIDNNILRTLFYTGINLIILLPLIVGTGYEFLMFAGKHNGIIVRILSAPGLWMQRLTTREPTDEQIEVAIRSLKLSMPDVFPPEETEAPADADGSGEADDASSSDAESDETVGS